MAATSARALAGLLASAALAATPLAVAPPSGSTPEIRFAVLPCTNIETSFRKFHPLLAHLTSATGFRFTLVVPADLAEFEAATRSGRTDFALQDPHTFEQLARLFDETSLLQTRGLDGTTSQSAVVVVRKDSGIRELGQLVGRTVMFGPRVSSPKWVAARLLFESSGIDVDRDLEALNGGCCEDIAFTVSIRSVDAGVICDHFLSVHGARQKDLGVDPAALTVIGRTVSLPTRIFAARKGVPADIVGRTTRALLGLDRTDPRLAAILNGAEIGGFVRTTEVDYLEAFGRAVARGSR
jgi:phosphonate transport system substrate-binding protein